MTHTVSTLQVRPGMYRTDDGRLVVITKVIGGRAYGRSADRRETTWWHADTGIHSELYEVIVEKLD